MNINNKQKLIVTILFLFIIGLISGYAKENANPFDKNKTAEFNKNVKEAIDNYENAKFDVAVGHFNRALKLDPENKGVQKWISDCDLMLNKQKKLLNSLPKSVAKRENLITQKYKDSVELYKKEEFARAKRAFEEVLLIKGDYKKTKSFLKKINEKFNTATTIPQMTSDVQIADAPKDNIEIKSEKPQKERVEVKKVKKEVKKEVEKVKEEKKVEKKVEKVDRSKEIDILLEQAKQLQAKGNVKKAIAEYEKVLQIDAKNKTALKEIKKIHEAKIEAENKKIAEEKLKAEKTLKDNIDKELKTGELLFSQKQYEKAIESFNKVLQLDKGNKKATALIKKSNDLIKKTAEESKELGIKKQKEIDKAAAENRKKIDGYIKKGKELINDKKYEKAITELHKALSIDQNNQDANKLLADAQAALKKEEEVKLAKQKEEESKKLAEASKKSEKAVIKKEVKKEVVVEQQKEVVVKHEEQQKIEIEEVKIVDQATPAVDKKLKEKADEKIQKGIKLYEKGQYEESLVLFKEGIDLVPLHEDAVKYTKLAENKIKEAKAKAELDVRNKQDQVQNKGKADKLLAEAKEFIAQSLYGNAKANLEDALKLNPDLKEAQNLLKICNAKIEEIEKVTLVQEEQKKKVEELQKKDQSAQLYADGLAKYKEKKIEEAVKLWNDAIVVNPNNQEAITFLAQTKTEYETYMTQKKKSEEESKKEEESEKKLDTLITYSTTQPTPLAKFLDTLSFISGINFFIASEVDAEVRAKFDEKPLREVLDIILKAEGLKWTRKGDVITIEPSLEIKMFKLSPEEMVKVSTLIEKGTLQKLIYGSDGKPKIKGVELELDERQSLLILRDSANHIKRVEAFLESLKKETPPELVSYFYQIQEKEGPKIKTLIESLLKSESDSIVIQEEQKVILHGSDLVIRATPDNIKKIEKFLLDNKFIEKITTSELEIRVFDLAPTQTLLDKPQQLRDFAEQVVEIIKTRLYSQIGVKEAQEQGRRLWYDPFTLQITIVDTRSNIEAIDRYISSLSQLKQNSKSKIIYLNHIDASTMASQIEDVLGISSDSSGAGGGRGNSISKTMRREDELEFRDVRVRVRTVNDNEADDENDDDVEITVRTATQSREYTIEEFTSEFVDDYEINVNEVKPSGTPGEGRAEIEIVYNPPQEEQALIEDQQQALAAAQAAAASTQASITPFSETNSLLIRYTNPSDLEEIISWIEKLDIPILQVSIETKFVEINESRAREYKADFEIMDLTSMGSLLSPDTSILSTQFAQDIDEVQNMFEPSFENPTNANLLKGTTALSLILGGSTNALSLELNFLEAEGVINVVSGPRLLVMNGESADFTISRRVDGTLAGGATTTTDEDTGDTTTTATGGGYDPVDIQIDQVTISQQGYITLDLDADIIDVENSLGQITDIVPDATEEYDETIPETITNTYLYATREKQITTRARIKDGGTIVLGGWTGQRSTSDSSGVPVLRNVPYIGKLLFSRSQEYIEKTTLLIFLTGHIVD